MHEHNGHRSRLREKLDKVDLQDHEYLELILCVAMPRRNTNDIAHRLISQFGSVAEVFSASYAELVKVKGVGEGVAGFLVSLGKLLGRRYQCQTATYRGRFDVPRFKSYLKELYETESREVLETYFLDENKFVFATKNLASGAEYRAEFDPTVLTQLILELKPAGIVLVHNHPKGSSVPSVADDETTGKCQIVCSYHNVVLCDHLICSKEGVYSYLTDEKLTEISKKYSVQNIVRG